MKTATLEQKELGEVVALADSGTWGDEGTTQTGSPVLRSTNIEGYRMVFDNPAWRVVPDNDRERRRLETGDIIVTKSSGSPDHIGKCAIFEDPQDGNDYYFSNFMLRLRADDSKLDHRWLFYWLTSDRGRFELQRLNSTTTGLRNLNVGLYLLQKIPLPPIPEQKRIADILAKADAIRRKRRDAVCIANTMPTSIFFEMFGDPHTNPKGWPPVLLRELVADGDKINYGVVQPGREFPGGVPVVRVGDLQNLRVSTEKLKRIDPEIEKSYARSRLVGDEILIACVGSIGMIALADSRVKSFNIVRAVARVRCNDKVNRLYLAAYLGTPAIQSYFQQATRTVSQPTLNIKQIEETAVLVPPLTLQERFASIAERHLHAIARLELAATEADTLFASIVQRAFRGEV
jgi:type I restriction enzyme S subunit